MMTLSTRAAATAFASLLLMSSALAQTTAPATPAPAAKTAPAAKAEKAPVVHTAASLECSKEADAKGLHGKERKKFRSECKKAAKDAPPRNDLLPSPATGEGDFRFRISHLMPCDTSCCEGWLLSANSKSRAASESKDPA